MVLESYDLDGETVMVQLQFYSWSRFKPVRIAYVLKKN
jgi:hypothetical protein